MIMLKLLGRLWLVGMLFRFMGFLLGKEMKSGFWVGSVKGILFNV